MSSTLDKLKSVYAQVQKGEEHKPSETSEKSEYDKTDESPGVALVKLLNEHYGDKFAENKTSYTNSMEWREYLQERMQTAIQQNKITDAELVKKIEANIPGTVIINQTVLHPKRYNFPVVLCTFVWAPEYRKTTDINNKDLTSLYYASLFLGYNEAAKLDSGKIIQNNNDLLEAIEFLIKEEFLTLEALGKP